MPVVWHGTDAYARKEASLPISSAAAYAKLDARRAGLPHPYFRPPPRCIFGDEYFFDTELSKVAAPPEGWFVNGRTGAIEHRTSKLVLESGQRSFPANAFVDVVRID